MLPGMMKSAHVFIITGTGYVNLSYKTRVMNHLGMKSRWCNMQLFLRLCNMTEKCHCIDTNGNIPLRVIRKPAFIQHIQVKLQYT
jgi:hypothetical protein